MPRKLKPDHISQKEWDALDVREWTRADFAKARPASDVLPEVVEAYRRSRGPQKAPVKKQVTLRLDEDVVAHFREEGPGWQTRINETLATAVRTARRTERKQGRKT